MDMEQLSYGSLGLIALATIFLSLVVRQAVKGGKDTHHGVTNKPPPGPWNLPVIGSLHHLAGTKLAHRALLRLSHQHGPVMLLKLGEVPTVIASTPEAAMEFLKTNDLALANRPSSPTVEVVGSGGKGLVFAPYGEHWRQMRKVCVVELLSTRQVARIESIKQEEVAYLVDSVAAAASSSSSSAINLGKALAKLASNVIARAAFGLKCPQQEAFLREIDALAILCGGFNVMDLFPSSRLVRWLSGADRGLRRSHGRVQEIIGDIIEDRKKASVSEEEEEEEDLLDVLLRLQKEDTLRSPLTSDIIGAVIFDMFGAATDTTAATLEWAMAELVRNPRVMTRAKLEVRQSLARSTTAVVMSTDLGNLHYLRMVIKETLRLHPAGALILRAARQNCQVMGYDIPKGTHVMVNAFAVGRDPAHWGDDAEEFRPERFESDDAVVEYKQGPHMEFIPFGAGRRQCPGALFATTTIELVLANLLYHFDWAIPGGAGAETLDMTEVFGIVLHARSSLCLEAVYWSQSTQDALVSMS